MSIILAKVMQEEKLFFLVEVGYFPENPNISNS